MGFQSLYVGATGLLVHGARMDVIGNNLANVNTVGFKGSDIRFENLFSKSLAGGDSSVQGLNQVGLGAGVAAIQGDFRQGGVETGSASTDLAIGGKGYFRVVKDGEILYTRAGNFRFDNQGFLVDPLGYRLQGQAIIDGTNGSTGDLQLTLNQDNQVVVDPLATSHVNMVLNLGGGSTDNSADAGNPFFALMQAYDGSSATPLAEGAYDYMNSITIYDSNGAARVLNVYFDGVGGTGQGGERQFEFVAAQDPAVDGRADFQGTSAAGLLMAGVLTFNAHGQLTDMAAYTYSAAASAQASNAGVKSLLSWVPSQLSADGEPTMEAVFATASGAAAAQAVMGLGFGLSNTGGSWAAGAASNAGGVGASASALAGFSEASRAALATTAYTGSTATLFQTQDGYGQGFLQSTSVNRQGIMEGKFSNGVVMDILQVTLYDFPSQYGLRREGGNHFSETQASGAAVEGLPDQDQFGSIMGQSLEASNVDMAGQFADMIITERGFQANSKVISTMDWMLQTAAQLKR